jgi:hypothetical protein
MCISVYDVVLKTDGTGGVQSKTLVGTTQRIEMTPPTASWYSTYNELQFDFRFLDPNATYYPMTAGHRIGVLVSASDHLNTPNSATASTDLAIMYDHPDYATSFGFETQ